MYGDVKKSECSVLGRIVRGRIILVPTGGLGGRSSSRCPSHLYHRYMLELVPTSSTVYVCIYLVTARNSGLFSLTPLLPFAAF